MKEKQLIQAGFKSLLEEIKSLRTGDRIYDEWIDSDVCSILGQWESRELGPFFEQYHELLEQLERIDKNWSQKLEKVKMAPPTREISTDDYGNQFVKYYFSTDHLEELEEEVMKAIELLF
ncbi:MAG: hypothetical protein DWQ02_19340 [Bacteroidetes bacterium]|nr:MAG: hypothetical protein DWQ02_19340 [Bacteroidota bacterium]